MANTVTLTLNISDNGDLKLVTSEAKKAAAGMKGVDAAATKATKSQDRYSKAAKGVGQTGLSASKGFSKMRGAMGDGSGGLVAAYATLAANVFALSAAFGALQRAAAFDLLERGLVRIGSAAGQNLPYIAQGLRDITGAAVSTQQSMTAVAVGISAGFSTTQLEKLTKVARGASIAMGRDMGDALDRLVRGTAKLEPEILDELGIMVRLDDAMREHGITLGKTANQLSQFERRQAFLNATIEQGLGKFGQLADDVDVNAYDKLAATFDDVAKSGLKIANEVLKPIVDFLASSPMALVGMMTLFASVILSKVVPSIHDSAQKARLMAKEAQRDVSKIALKAETAFKKASKKLQNLKFIPPSLDGLNSKLKKGTATAEDLAFAVKRITMQETARAKNIANDKVRRAGAAEELAIIRAQKAELQQLIIIEKSRTGQAGKLSRAKSRSSLNRKQGAAMGMMEDASPLKAFKIAAASSGKQAKEIGKSVGAVNKLGTAFGVTVNSAKLFGTAFVKFIPYIGWAITAISILKPLLGGLFTKTELEKQIDKIVESFQEFDKVGRQLEKTLILDRGALEDFVSVMRVQVGLVNQLAAALKAVQAADAANTQKDMMVKIRERIKAEEKLAKYEATHGKNRANLMASAQIDIHRINREYEALKGTLDKVNKAGTLVTIDTYIANIEANTTLTKAMKEQLVGLKVLREEVFKDEITSNAIVNEKVKALTSNQEKSVAAIDSAKQAFGEFRAEVDKIGARKSSPFDAIIEKAQGMGNELDNAMKSNDVQAGVDSFIARVPGYQKVLEKFGATQQYIFGSGIDRVQNKGVKEAAAALTADLTKQRNIIITSAANVKTLSAESKKLGKITKGNGEVMQQYLTKEREISAEKKKALDAELKIYNTLDLQKANAERILQINAELGTILAEKLDISLDLLKISVEESVHAKKIADFAAKTQASNSESTKSILAASAAKMKAAKLESNQPVRAIDELNLFNEQKTIKEDMLAAETTSKLNVLEAEWNLYFAELALEKAKAKTLGANTAGLQVYVDLFDAAVKAESAAFNAITNAEIGGGQSATTEGAVKTRAVEKAVLGSVKGEGSAADKANNMILEGGFEKLDSGLEKMQALRGMFSQNLADLSALGPEGEAVSAAVNAFGIMGESALNFGDIVSGVFERMGIQVPTSIDGMSAAWDKMADTDKAQVAAAAFNMAAQSIAGLASALAAQSKAAISKVDDQIDAEKKLDGQSAASVAKIKALEAKKEQMKKKAFETDKKMKVAMAIMSTAAGIASALTLPPPLSFIMAGIVGAMGLAQVAIISGMKYGGGAKPSASMPSSVSIGKRSSSVDLAKGNNASGELAYARGASGQGGMTDFKPTPAFTGTKYRASGGETAAFMVGEQGPEMFIPDRAGRIAPADETAKMNNAPTNINFSIQAIDSAGVEDLLNNQRGNIISMIREAANSHGEFFLESVTDFPAQEKQR